MYVQGFWIPSRAAASATRLMEKGCERLQSEGGVSAEHQDAFEKAWGSLVLLGYQRRASAHHERGKADQMALNPYWKARPQIASMLEARSHGENRPSFCSRQADPTRTQFRQANAVDEF